MSSATQLLDRLRAADDRRLALQVVQPGLIGLIDGTISTLAPIFATAYLAGSREALLVGVAAALGAAISMGLSEGLSDDGSLTGRGSSLSRGWITGGATFVGGSLHALPFLIADVDRALTLAYGVVAVELVLIAWIRRRFMRVSLTRSLIQVTLGGVIVATVGVVIGNARSLARLVALGHEPPGCRQPPRVLEHLCELVLVDVLEPHQEVAVALVVTGLEEDLRLGLHQEPLLALVDLRHQHGVPVAQAREELAPHLPRGCSV